MSRRSMSTGRGRFGIAVLVLAILGMLALAGVATAQNDSDDFRPAWSDETPWSAPDVAQIIERTRQQAVEAGPPEQAAVLARGVPTTEEYRAAIQRTIDCARATGVTIDGPHERAGGLLLGYGVVDTDEQALPRFDACYAQHASYIDPVYQMSIERQRFEQDRPVVECIRGEGVNVSVPHPVTGEPTDAAGLPLGMLVKHLSGEDVAKAVSCLK